MSVFCCVRCGINVPRGTRQCTFCKSATTAPFPLPASADGTYWIAVRCQFKCRSCGHDSALDHLDSDGSVECRKCGLDQAFDVERWSAALASAHAAGDLAGPEPEGRHPHPWLSVHRSNPFATLAVLLASAPCEGDIQLVVAPGHPACGRCEGPLDTRSDGVSTQTRCARCGDAATYAVPANARAMDAGLRGVVAHDNRSDRPAVQLQGSAATGTVAILCAQCSAPIGAPSGDGKLVTCRFCGTTCRVPSRALLRSLDGPSTPETWWLAFAGPSALRAELELGESNKKAIELAPERPAPTPLRLLVAVGVPLAVLGIVAGILTALGR